MKYLIIPLLFLLAPLASSQGWSTHLTIDGQEADAWFGSNVNAGPDLDGDGLPDLLIGEGNADGVAGTDVGKAYVLSSSDGSVIFMWEGEEAWDHFGGHVLALGDVDADGVCDIGIAAPGHYGINNFGKVHVFSGATGLEVLFISGTFNNQYLGAGMSRVGDIDGDGHADLVLGTEFAVPDAADYIAAFSGATGLELWRTTWPTWGGQFGKQIAPIEDLDDDGIADLIVSAKRADIGGTNTGTVFLYSGADGQFIDSFSGTEPGAELGDHITSAGDVNGDGVADVIVGAMYADPGGRADAGSVYVLSGADLSDELFRLDGPVSSDYMGRWIAGGLDWNADGIPDFACGAPGTTNEWSSALGAVYMFSGKDGSLFQTIAGTDPGGYWGGCIAALDDVSGDGSADLIISSRFADLIAGVDSGQVSVLASPGTFSFSVLGLSPGQPVTLSASDCRPNATVHPVYSLSGGGMTWIPDRFALALDNPAHNLPTITMNGAGSGFEILYLPPHVPPGLNILWQAVEVWRNGGQNEYRVSNLLETTVQ